MTKIHDIETWTGDMYTPEEAYTWFDYETWHTREEWDLNYIDGRGCKNQHDALLDIIAKGIGQIAVELHAQNEKLDRILKMQEQHQEPAEQIQEAEDENQAKH